MLNRQSWSWYIEQARKMLGQSKSLDEEIHSLNKQSKNLRDQSKSLNKHNSVTAWLIITSKNKLKALLYHPTPSEDPQAATC